MPNKNYVKGRRKEYKIIHEAKALGMLAFRSAGSHSPIDVVCIDPIAKEIMFVQCKPDDMSVNEKNKLKEENQGLNGEFRVRFEVI